MRLSSAFSFVLTLIGGILFFIALLSGGVSILALIERLRHGRGIMFADVEFFGFAAIVCGLPGVLLVIVARKLSRANRTDHDDKKGARNA